jgi:GAF domain-containing protein
LRSFAIDGRPRRDAIVMTSSTDSDRLDTNEALRALSTMVLSNFDFDMVLERATLVVKQTIPGAAEVSVTVQNGQPLTVASSGPLAIEVDESQYVAGYGPCLDAIRLGQTVVVDDQSTETRWPDYTPRAVEAGVRSSLSVPLPVDGRHVGAFNIYGLQPHLFPPEVAEVAEQLAAYAAIVLNNAGLYFTAAARAEQMTEALGSRAVIDQAKGILMGSRHCDADEAFGILVKLSQQTGQKLHAVAQKLVETTVNSEK